MAVGDLGVQAHRDVGGGLDLADQVLRHRPRQVVAPHQHRHLPGVPRQVQRGLARRVPGADDEHVAAFHRLRLAAGRAVEDAGADQRLQARHAKTPPGDARRDDDRLGRDLVAVGEVHDAFAALALQADGCAGQNTMCAPNIQACSQARRVSSCPLMPCAKPG